MKNSLTKLAVALFPLGILTLLSACEVQSVNGTARVVDANVSGVYRASSSNENNGKFVSQNSGSPVTFMDLRQNGSKLEGVDNNRIVFRGDIGSVSDDTVSFNLEGSTTAGKAATINGSIEIGGGQGIMRATWIEDSLYGTVYGVANGPTINTNVPSPTNSLVSVRPSSTNLVSDAQEFSLTASGGSGQYEWSVDIDARGTLNQFDGATVTYRRKTAGDNKVTVIDKNDSSNKDICTVTQP